MKRWIGVLMTLVMLLSNALAAERFRPRDMQDAQEKALALAQLCAFGSEYGEEHPLARWEQPLRIYVGGEPTQADLDKLDEFLLDLKANVPCMPEAFRVSHEVDANVRIYYVPLERMGDYLEDYQPGNWGFVTYWYNGSLEIYQMKIAIASDVTDQKERNHLLMEEMVGGLGLCIDHEVYSDSILYQPWTTTQMLSVVDWLMLEMIYHPDVHSNMTREEFGRVTRQRIYSE